MSGCKEKIQDALNGAEVELLRKVKKAIEIYNHLEKRGWAHNG
jgi:hypothetical protein